MRKVISAAALYLALRVLEVIQADILILRRRSQTETNVIRTFDVETRHLFELPFPSILSFTDDHRRRLE